MDLECQCVSGADERERDGVEGRRGPVLGGQIRFLVSLGLFWAACATTQPMVDVQGKDLDVTQLAGKWEGTYHGKDSGRSGTVTFDLIAGYRVAEGKVIMNALADPAHAQPLQVKFIEIEGRQVGGTISPYTDPGCNCTVETKFVGRLSGRLIEGTFTTHPVGGTQEQGGTWSVSRKE